MRTQRSGVVLVPTPLVVSLVFLGVTIVTAALCGTAVGARRRPLLEAPR